jgi:hypothetical protein
MHQTPFILEDLPSGRRIEFGVLNGSSTRLIMQYADVMYAVDSFEGMAEPSAADYREDGTCEYPKGRLAVSVEEYRAKFQKEIACGRLLVYKGFVPAVLEDLPQNVSFAFAYVDMDQYAPTVHALNWLWPRMLRGGVIFCDDWFADCMVGASKALNEASVDKRPFSGTHWRRCWWRF